MRTSRTCSQTDACSPIHHQLSGSIINRARTEAQRGVCLPWRVSFILLHKFITTIRHKKRAPVKSKKSLPLRWPLLVHLPFPLPPTVTEQLCCQWANFSIRQSLEHKEQTKPSCGYEWNCSHEYEYFGLWRLMLAVRFAVLHYTYGWLGAELSPARWFSVSPCRKCVIKRNAPANWATLLEPSIMWLLLPLHLRRTPLQPYAPGLWLQLSSSDSTCLCGPVLHIFVRFARYNWSIVFALLGAYYCSVWQLIKLK